MGPSHGWDLGQWSAPAVKPLLRRILGPEQRLWAAGAQEEEGTVFDRGSVS